MGDCRYCKRPAGFLRSQHADCNQKHSKALAETKDLALRSLSADESFDGLRSSLIEFSRSSFVEADQVDKVLASAWTEAVNQALDDGLLTEEEERRLTRSKNSLALPEHASGVEKSLTRLVQAAVLRDIANGVVPSRVQLDGVVPFNLQKSETLIWAFPGAVLLKDVKRRHYEGGSRGVGIRVAKGLYYRVGAFKAYPVVTTNHEEIDSGLLGVTNKHLYFSGATKHFRVPHKKIVAVIPYQDGIGIQKDGTRDAYMSFKIGDGWFAYNLFSNMNQLS